jgi:hypothetical protein
MKGDFREKTSRPGEPLTPLTSEEGRRAAEDGHVTPWDTSKGRKLTSPRSLFGAYDEQFESKSSIGETRRLHKLAPFLRSGRAGDLAMH